MTDGRLRVAVLAGGASGEHDVSRASGESIAAHLDPARYDVVRVFIGRDGRWSVGAAGAPARRPRGTVADGIAAALAVLRGVDVVFPALHGVYGEDGTVQAVLDRAGVPYVGNPAPASAMGMDKVFTKRLLAAAGIPVADSVLLRGGADTLPAPDRDRLGLPAFVKPARGGSSLGVARLTDWAGLPAAVSAARCAGDRVLVEAAVAGREVDVAVLEYPDGRLVAGPPLEIRVAGGREFFDFDAKYAAGDTVFDVPARIPADAAAAVRRLAVRAFRALDCAGLLRVDFFLPAGGGPPVLNEVNTFPGFTAASQYPRIWAAAGLLYPRLLAILIDTALARHGRPAAGLAGASGTSGGGGRG